MLGHAARQRRVLAVFVLVAADANVALAHRRCRIGAVLVVDADHTVVTLTARSGSIVAIAVEAALHAFAVVADGCRRAATGVSEALDALAGSHDAERLLGVAAIEVGATRGVALAVDAAGLRGPAIGIDQAFVTRTVVQIADRSGRPAIRYGGTFGALGARRVTDRLARAGGTIRCALTADAHTRVGQTKWRVSGAVAIRGTAGLALRVPRETCLARAAASAGSTFATLPEHTRRLAAILAVRVTHAVGAAKVRGAAVDALVAADGAARGACAR